MEVIIDLTNSFKIDEDYTFKATFFVDPKLINTDAKVLFKGEVYKIIDWQYSQPQNEYHKTNVEIELCRLHIWSL